VTYKLRSMSGLLAFDAAARHESLTLAARELGRTQSAVSQQVKQLEEQTGLTLFVRRPRKVVLTREGQAFAATVRNLIQTTEDKIGQLQNTYDENVLRLTTYQSFATQWLMPRLARFNLRFPKIDVRVNVDDQRLDLRASGHDIAVRIGKLPAGEEALIPETYMPVYAPSLAPEKDLTVADIARYPLLAHEHADFWQEWFTVNNCEVSALDISADYSHSGLLVQAAAAGGGVALAPIAIASDAIVAGRLKCVVGKSVESDCAYYVSVAKGDIALKVESFYMWIHDEIKQMNKDMAEYM